MPQISITISPDLNKKSFRKKETLIVFLEAEQEYWQEFFHYRTPSTSLEPSVIAIRNNFNKQYAEALTKAREIDDDFSQIEDVQDYISEKYIHNQLIYSASPFSNFVSSYKEEILAAYIAGSYLSNGYENALYNARGNIANQSFNSHKNEILKYFSEAHVIRTMFEQGFQSNIDPERESLATLKNEWNNLLTGSKNDIDKQDEKFTLLKSEIKEHQGKTGTFFSKQNRRFAKFMNQSRKEMKEFEDFYEKELALKSAVIYWKSKKKTSYILASILGLALLSIGGFTIDYLFELSNSIGQNINNLSASTTSDKKDLVSKLKYLPILHFLVISTFAIWGIRILVKIFLSKLHAADNASEREMFIKSYLALLNEHKGSVVDEKDRHLILQAIFRPSSDGLINDEGPKITDIINSIKSK